MLVKDCRYAVFAYPGAMLAQLRAFLISPEEQTTALHKAYLKSFPVAGVAMVQISDTKATWDFLVVWQRGRISEPCGALLDALATSASTRANSEAPS